MSLNTTNISMGSAYGFSNCVGWYRAGIGLYADAGITPAATGDTIAQWNDQSGSENHLTQSTPSASPTCNTYRTQGPAGAFAPFGTATNTYAVDEPAGVLFDGNSSYLNLPASMALAPAGSTVILCSRGFAWMPIGFGGGDEFLAYGFLGGAGQMGFITGNGATAFSVGTTLPFHVPLVHGFIADGSANNTRLFMGTRQGDLLQSNCLNVALNGGTIGRMPGSFGDMGNGFFNGEILELVIFNTPLTAIDAQLVISQMQDANGIAADANTNLLAFIGDGQTCGGPGIAPICQSYPYWLSRAYAGAVKPLQLAAPSATCAQQLSAVQTQLAAQNRSTFSNVVAICCCGIQDIVAGATDLQTQANWIALAQAIKAIPNTKLLAVVPIHQQTASALSAQQLQYIQNFQQWLEGNAGRYADAVIDWSADARLSNTSTDPTYWADEFHSTETGDRIKAALLKPALDRLLGIATTPAGLQYGAFYGTDRNYAGGYGNFVKT